MKTIKKVFVFLFRRTRLAYKKQEAQQTGFFLGENFQKRDNYSLLNMFIRMLVVNCFVLGTLDAFMSAFNIPYNAPYVFGMITAINFVIMLCQFNLVTRIAAYVVIFWKITEYYINNITLIRSGLNALTNLMYELVRVKFKLPSVDGFTEIIADRNITITAVLIVMCIYYAMFLWESCGRMMNIVISGFLSLAVISMGLYFDGVPSYASILMLSTAWLIAACIKLNGKYPYSFRKNAQYKVYLWKNKHYYYKLLNGKAFAQFFVLTLALMTVTLGIGDVFISKQAFDETVPVSEEKEYSDFLIKDMMITAFSHYKNYSVQTLASSGQLGRYASVEPDGQPDLEVTFVPEKPGRQYLKSFVGTDYTDSMWVSYSSLRDKEQSFETSYAAKKNNEPARKMVIKNLDIITESPFLPYYTDIDSNENIVYVDDIKNELDMPLFSSYEVKYYSEPDISVADEAYRKYVYDNYLTVPDKNRGLIEQLCEEKGFSADDPELENKLADFFESEYKYSLNPGLVPWKTDFVNYFLFENKVGLCAHFASAGTLIYRTLGIPARYVEGYALDYAPGMYEDEVVHENEDPRDWVGEGGAAISPYPVTVKVSDIYAHGWVEVYKDGYGWTPVELTPGADELETEKKEDETLGGKLMTLLLESRHEELTPEERTEYYKEVTAGIGIYLISAAGMAVILALFFCVLRILFRHIKRLALFSRRNADSVIGIYTYIMAVFEYLGTLENPSHKEMCAELSKYMRSADVVTETVERILYSPEKPGEDECLNAFISLHGALGHIYKKAGFVKTAVMMLKL